MASNYARQAEKAAVRHGFGERQRNRFPDPGFIPSPKTPVDRVPVPVFGRDIATWGPATQPTEYPIDDRAVLLGTPTASSVLRLNRQQTLQNTRFRFAEITPAQACLQKAALNQPVR